jgi:hypothetical protein
MPSKAAIGWLHHRSLVWRFLLSGLAALAPLVAALVQFAGNERDWAIQVTRERAELLVSHALDNHRRIVDDAQTMLSTLAGMPEVRAAGPACDTILAQYAALHQWATSLQLSDADGTVTCADRASMKGFNLSGRESFGRALHEQSFVLSDLGTDRITGALSMKAAMPVAQGGRIVGILSMGIRSSLFQERAVKGGSPTEISMFLVDQKATLIAHDPPLSHLLGSSVGNRVVVQKALGHAEGGRARRHRRYHGERCRHGTTRPAASS